MRIFLGKDWVVDILSKNIADDIFFNEIKKYAHLNQSEIINKE